MGKGEESVFLGVDELGFRVVFGFFCLRVKRERSFFLKVVVLEKEGGDEEINVFFMNGVVNVEYVSVDGLERIVKEEGRLYLEFLVRVVLIVVKEEGRIFVVFEEGFEVGMLVDVVEVGNEEEFVIVVKFVWKKCEGIEENGKLFFFGEGWNVRDIGLGFVLKREVFFECEKR